MIAGIHRGFTAMLYPGARIQLSEPFVAGTLGAEERLEYSMTGRGERIAVILRNCDHEGRWVLFLGGNGMTAAHAADLRAALASEGLNSACADYPGFGLSGGAPTESGCYRAGDAALDVLARTAGVGPDRVVVIGWSLGSAVALDLAQRRPGVRGVVLLSPLTSVASVALGITRLQVALLDMVGPFSALRKAGRVSCPALVITGTEDSLTRPRMARKVAARLRGRVAYMEIEGRGHIDLLDSGCPLWAKVARFARNLDVPS